MKQSQIPLRNPIPQIQSQNSGHRPHRLAQAASYRHHDNSAPSENRNIEPESVSNREFDKFNRTPRRVQESYSNWPKQLEEFSQNQDQREGEICSIKGSHSTNVTEFSLRFRSHASNN